MMRVAAGSPSCKGNPSLRRLQPVDRFDVGGRSTPSRHQYATVATVPDDYEPEAIFSNHTWTVVLSQVVDIRRSYGDQYIHYLSGLELLSADDHDDLPDGTHPDMAGHAKMGRLLKRRDLINP